MKTAITTSRLILKLTELNDLNAIHELHLLPETDEFNTLGIPEDLKQTREVLQEWIKVAKKDICPEFTFSIRDKNTNDFIGLIALKCGNPKFRIAEVWYKLHVKHWRKGFATEALTGILDYGFNDLQLHRIEAGCATANIGSIKVLEKVGMTLEGRKRKVLPLKDGWSDNYSFAILEEDWRKIFEV